MDSIRIWFQNPASAFVGTTQIKRFFFIYLFVYFTRFTFSLFKCYNKFYSIIFYSNNEYDTCRLKAIFSVVLNNYRQVYRFQSMQNYAKSPEVTSFSGKYEPIVCFQKTVRRTFNKITGVFTRQTRVSRYRRVYLQDAVTTQ